MLRLFRCFYISNIEEREMRRGVETLVLYMLSLIAR